MPLPELTLLARYVFPVDGPPIENGCVRVAGERITFVGPADRQPDIDFGDAAIVPGFVNAHTHLELSSLRAKDFAAPDFTGWLRRVIEARRGQNATSVAHAIQRGIDSSLAAGTTLLGDVSTGGRSWKELQRSPLRAIVFCELLGLKSQRAAETARAARQFLEWANPPNGTASGSAGPVTPAEPATGFVFEDGTAIDPLPAHVGLARGLARRLTASLSPHAPYSTHPLLFDLAASWARTSGIPLCSHLAESLEERQLLERDAGPLRQLLNSISAWNDDWGGPARPSPLEYVDFSDCASVDWVIAHANYASSSEIARLGSEATSGRRRIAIVYCPRTHAYFGHSRHPYSEMLAAGLTVCLGTDSLASTPSLSILDELRFLHRRDESLPTATILYMATWAGANALGRVSVCGSLTPGKFADLTVVRLPDREDEDPHRLLLQSDLPVIRTMIGGRFVFHLR